VAVGVADGATAGSDPTSRFTGSQTDRENRSSCYSVNWRGDFGEDGDEVSVAIAGQCDIV
jgi:hypothetical protein